MATIHLNKPQPRQIEFLQAKERFVGYGGARGGGKSWAIRFKAVGMCCKYERLKFLIIRRTYTELEENHIAPLKEILRECLDEKKIRYDSAQHRFEFWNGATIKCGYCDSLSDLEHYQGLDYDIIALDEATHHTEEVFSVLGACLRGNVDLPKRMYLTCNPGGVGHEWVKRLFVTREYMYGENPEDYRFVKALATDNVYNGKGYMQMLDKLQEPLRSAWRDGSWDTFVGQYFPEWDLASMTVPITEIPDNWKISMSIDYGLDCFAPLWFATDENGTDYIIREASIKNMIVTDAAKTIIDIEKDLGLDKRQIRRYAPGDLWARKSDTGRSTIDWFGQFGLHFIKSINDREMGWLAVKERLADGSLKVFDGRANQLSYCMRLLQHDEIKLNDVAKEPHKITHLPDSLRYYLVIRGQKAKVIVPNTSHNIVIGSGKIVKNKPKIRINGILGK